MGTPYLGLPTLEGADKRSAERAFIRACHGRRRRKGLHWKKEAETGQRKCSVRVVG